MKSLGWIVVVALSIMISLGGIALVKVSLKPSIDEMTSTTEVVGKTIFSSQSMDLVRICDGYTLVYVAYAKNDSRGGVDVEFILGGCK